MSHEPDWDYLGTVAVRIGLDWARTLRDAFADGTLVDLGAAESQPELEAPLPARRDAARPEQLLLELRANTGGMGGKHGKPGKPRVSSES